MSEVTPRDREEKLLAAIADGATEELPTPRNRKEKLLKEIYNNGTAGGGGESTIAWRPTVDVNGNISWERTVSTITPATQNIKGPQGDPGEVAITYQVVKALPEIGIQGCMYLIHKSGAKDKNIFDEYMFLEGAWELIGDTGTTVLDTYSTDEIICGTWIDKPLYRKVVTAKITKLKGTTIVIPSSQMDGINVKNMSGIVRRNDGWIGSINTVVNGDGANTISAVICTYIDISNNLTVRTFFGVGSYFDLELVLEYTKTTD